MWATSAEQLLMRWAEVLSEWKQILKKHKTLCQILWYSWNMAHKEAMKDKDSYYALSHKSKEWNSPASTAQERTKT